MRAARSLAPHDFAITPSWYVFAHNDMELDILPFAAGLKGPVECLRTTGGGVTLQLVPRPGAAHADAADAATGGHGSDGVVVPTDDPYFNIHHATAFEEDVRRFARPPIPAAWAHLPTRPRLRPHPRSHRGQDGATVTLFTAGWPSVEPGPFLGDWGGAVPVYDDGKIAPTQLFETTIEVGAGADGAARATRRVAVQACIDHPHVGPLG